MGLLSSIGKSIKKTVSRIGSAIKRGLTNVRNTLFGPPVEIKFPKQEAPVLPEQAFFAQGLDRYRTRRGGLRSTLLTGPLGLVGGAGERKTLLG
jgi:hypothetical protein